MGEDTTNGLDGASSTCGGSGGIDLVYEFTIPSGPNQRARITVDNASEFDPVIYAWSDCDPGTEIDCAQSSTGPSDVLDMPNLAPGTYAVWVDAMSSGAGTFDILLELLAAVPAPPHDTCSSPDPLLEGVAGAGH